MDIAFQTKKWDLSAGKRFHICEDEASREEEETIETSRKYFHSNGDCMMEVFRVTVNREGHISGKIFIDIGP